jgi:hypothetical protein
MAGEVPYEPPRVERALSAEDLDDEVLGAADASPLEW